MRVSETLITSAARCAAPDPVFRVLQVQDCRIFKRGVYQGLRFGHCVRGFMYNFVLVTSSLKSVFGGGGRVWGLPAPASRTSTTRNSVGFRVLTVPPKNKLVPEFPGVPEGVPRRARQSMRHIDPPAPVRSACRC